MKKNKLILIFFFVLQIIHAQQLSRQLINGVVEDGAKGIENVTITNLTIQKYTVSDKDGEFYILARENDTLLFSILGFNSKKLVIQSSKFKQLHVELDPSVNNLEEVIITPHALTGNLEKDYKNIKTDPAKIGNLAGLGQNFYADDNKSARANTLMPGYVDTRYMMDFNAIGKKIIRLFKSPKKESKAPVFTSKEIFPVAVRQRIPDSFFVETLQIKETEIGLFLSYCEKDPQAEPLLEIRKEFELIDFLVSKHKEYQNLKKE